MGIMKTAGNWVVGKFNGGKMWVRANGSTILLVGGVATIVGSTVYACYKTMQIEPILDEHTDEMNDIHHMQVVANDTNAIEYDERQRAVDICKVYAHTGMKLAKLYAVPTAGLTVGVVMVCKAYSMVSDEAAAALALAESTKLLFEKYRERVVENEGAVADHYYLTGTKIEESVEVVKDENGNDTTVIKKKIAKDDPDFCNRSIFVWDETNGNFRTELPGRSALMAKKMNLAMLKGQFDQANAQLATNGYLTTNEFRKLIADEMSIDAYGQMDGWIRNKNNDTYKNVILSGIREIDAVWLNELVAAALPSYWTYEEYAEMYGEYNADIYFNGVKDNLCIADDEGACHIYLNVEPDIVHNYKIGWRGTHGK